MSDSDLPEEEPEPSAPFWMTTFSDMATLLLTFFVLIVSMSEVEVKKFKEAFSYFQGSSSVLDYSAAIPSPPRQERPDSGDVEQARRLEELMTYLAQNDLEEKIHVNTTSEGLQIIITDSVVFASGSAVVLPEAEGVLRQISRAIGAHVSGVRVEGHTDDRPIQTFAFPSNWELSAARAASVVRFFLEQADRIDPASYTAIGRGEFHPVASNATPAGRAKNRRVEIFLQSHDGGTD